MYLQVVEVVLIAYVISTTASPFGDDKDPKPVKHETFGKYKTFGRNENVVR